MKPDLTNAEAWGAPLDDPFPPPLNAFGALLDSRTALKPHYTVGEPPLEVHVEAETPWVFWKGSQYVPATFRASVTEPGEPWAVLAIVVEDGGLAVAEATFLREPGRLSIRSQDIKRNVDGVKRRAAALVAASVRRDTNGKSWLVRDNETLVEFLETYENAARERGRGVRVSDDDVRTAARIYLAAETRRIWHIQNDMHVSKSTANRYVGLAKERGYIPERTKGAE